ncbi:MAG: hypothetical protein GXP08_11625 [Gammaproteobacteria bacterium]|nr:hypothetical protein [Gammaproteobacteria bacterium]
MINAPPLNHPSKSWKQLTVMITGVTVFVVIAFILDLSFSGNHNNNNHGVTISRLKANITDTFTFSTTTRPFSTNNNSPLDEGTVRPSALQQEIASTKVKTSQSSVLESVNNADNETTTPSGNKQNTRNNEKLDDVYDQVFAREFSPTAAINDNQITLTNEEMAIAAAITGITIDDASINEETEQVIPSNHATQYPSRNTAHKTKKTSNTTAPKRLPPQQQIKPKTAAAPKPTSPNNKKAAINTSIEKNKTAAQQHGINNRDSAKISASIPDGHITTAELNTLLSKFMQAYEAGDLTRLVSIFAENMRSNQETNLKNIEEDYRKLFHITDIRKMRISSVRWTETDKRQYGKGKFQLLVREKGAAKVTSYAGNISIDVEKNGQKLLIKTLNYHYNN